MPKLLGQAEEHGNWQQNHINHTRQLQHVTSKSDRFRIGKIHCRKPSKRNISLEIRFKFVETSLACGAANLQRARPSLNLTTVLGDWASTCICRYHSHISFLILLRKSSSISRWWFHFLKNLYPYLGGWSSFCRVDLGIENGTMGSTELWEGRGFRNDWWRRQRRCHSYVIYNQVSNYNCTRTENSYIHDYIYI